MIRADEQGVVLPYVRRPLRLQRLLLAESATVNRMLIELEIECLENRGQNNGKIIHTYSDFEQNGTDRKAIKPALTRMVKIGVLRIHSGQAGVGDHKRAHRFRLTYLPTWDDKRKRWIPATNEWLKTRPTVGKTPLRHVVGETPLLSLTKRVRINGKEIPVN